MYEWVVSVQNNEFKQDVVGMAITSALQNSAYNWWHNQLKNIHQLSESLK